MTLADHTPQAEYERRRAEARAEDARFDDWSAVTGNGRVLLVLIALALFGWAHSYGRPHPWTAYGVLALLAFVSLIVQGVADRRRLRASLRTKHYDRSLDRLAGKWKALPARGVRLDDAAHPYARDLDVVGAGSLFQLLDTTRTERGESALGGWLLTPSSLAAITARREALRVLQPEVDARERLAIAGLDEELSRIDEGPLLAWAEGPDLFAPPGVVRWLARVLPIVTIATYALYKAALVPGWPLIPLASAHVVLIARTRASISKIGHLAETTELTLKRLLPLLTAARTQPVSTPLLADAVARLGGAVEAIGVLRRRVSIFQSRLNIIVALLSPLLLWDVHAGLLLQAWRGRYGAQMRGWFEALGTIEALSACATYAYEHPDDHWPELVDGPATLQATGLGHPLLDATKCVRNDVALEGPGTALLVTGSNMSGKSTLLRSVGLNVVMALAGLPVRATSLRVSLVQVATSMRVADSLQEGASFFLAEVKRLKGVVDLAHGPRPVLFLLDEILQGTNTRERSLGARGVIAHLLEAGAFGFVSTHDLSLARLGDQFHERIRYAHFTDQVEGDQMTFDYRLKPGVVQTSNALRLMRAVGLKVDVPEDEPSSTSG